MSTATRLREAALIGHTRPELSDLAQLMLDAGMRPGIEQPKSS